MSIRSKLSIAISLIVSFILILNVTFSHINAVHVQKKNIEQQVTNIAQQLAVSIELIENTNRSIEQELAQRLKAAAQAAEQMLDSDINNITINELKEVRSALNIEDLTLWVMEDDGELRSVISTNPNEINLRSKTWDYWDVALKEIIHLKPVTVPLGERSEHFYSGPINFAVSDPTQVNKWGYYYSGKTNYMINTIINTDHSFPDGYINGKENIVKQLIADNESLLEITAFDPDFVGKAKIIKLKQGKPIYNLDVRDVKFGTYEYNNIEEDSQLIHQAISSNELQSSTFMHNNQKLTRTFFPVEANHDDYVISIVLDQNTLESNTTKQLWDHSIIAIMLLFVAIVGSYLIAQLLVAPLAKIMIKVNDISKNQFNTPLVHKSKDELGLLATQVNTMGYNLFHYTEELKAANLELLNTKQYLQSFFNNTKDALHIMDLDYNVVQVNQAFEQLFEYDSMEIVGHPLYPVGKEQNTYKILLQNALQNNGLSNYETIMYTKSGQALDVSITLSTIYDEIGNTIAFASITRNITQQKYNEELKRTNEKLTAVGQIAASIAHEIRNPLTTIKGFLTLNKATSGIPERHMNLVMQEIQHMDIIVSQFLNMSKPTIEKFELLNIYSLISDIITLKQSSAKLCHIEVVLTCEENLPLVRGSEQHLKQVFDNLINNSIEAMPEEGELSIQLMIEQHNDLSIKQMLILIKDTGCGLSEEELKRICEPFYTSKENGNGLGLLVCQQIIASHQGTLTFTSKLGEGTTATISIPIN